MRSIETEWGEVEVEIEDLELGEIVVTDDGTELEVTNLDPLEFDVAPEEEEDWGE